MTDASNTDYYQPSKGSLTGFDQANIPTGGQDLAVTGWSLEAQRQFLLNQSGLNFPSPEWLQEIEQSMLNHQQDFDNPHHTSLDQIVGSFVKQVLGNITPGTVPTIAPFFAFDAALGLPIGTLFPAAYTTSNLYRQTAGGWYADPSVETSVIGTDYSSGRAGLPMFSAMTNIIHTDWATQGDTSLNTSLDLSTDPTSRYPFSFYDVKETPINAQFGVDLPMTQDLSTVYTSSFFIRPTALDGTLRIYQPGDAGEYLTVNLSDGTFVVTGTNLIASCVRYADGVIRVSVSYTTLSPVADDALRIVHINEGSTGDGTRTGSMGRHLFSIAQPQTTRVTLNQPVIKNLATGAATSVLALDLAKLSVPTSLDRITLSLVIDIHPMLTLAPVVDPTILSFGPLTITRDQSEIRVSVEGNPIFESTILDGLNIITLSYSPTKLIFKDLAGVRQSVVGTYPVLPTATVNFGPFGGYLHRAVFYAQDDTLETVEYLTNG